jgi:TIR domain
MERAGSRSRGVSRTDENAAATACDAILNSLGWFKDSGGKTRLVIKMATSKEYFEKNTFLEFGTELTFEMSDKPLVVAPVKVAYDFEGGSKYVRAYIPECELPDSVAVSLAENIDLVWEKAKDPAVVIGFAGTLEHVTAAELPFSGRILIYTPTIIPNERWIAAKDILARLGLRLMVRDGVYAKARDQLEKPLAFISHDSRDKDALVRELAEKLTRMSCPVWYDEYKLVPGQSLRESIESGLKACPKCVVVLSKNFFSNPGWTKREFDSVYTREIIEGKRVMIPVWLGVTKQEVYDYSPILADTVGIKADAGVDEVARRLFGVLTNLV